MHCADKGSYKRKVAESDDYNVQGAGASSAREPRARRMQVAPSGADKIRVVHLNLAREEFVELSREDAVEDRLTITPILIVTDRKVSGCIVE